MMFSALFSVLITCLLLFLDISTIALMFPFNWGKVVSYSNILFANDIIKYQSKFAIHLILDLNYGYFLFFYIIHIEYILVPWCRITFYNRVDTYTSYGTVR